MRKEKQKSRDKPHFCHDVNQQFHDLNKKCNKYAMFISSVRITKNPKAKDLEIVKVCNKNDYHIITHNKGDFIPTQKMNLGIILVGLNDEEDFIPKFIKLFRKLPNHKDYYYKTINIGESIIITDRRTNEYNIL